MLEINAYGSLEDRRQSLSGGVASEEKLRERLADAMVDLNGDINHKVVGMNGNSNGVVQGVNTSPCMQPVRTVTGKLQTQCVPHLCYISYYD